MQCASTHWQVRCMHAARKCRMKLRKSRHIVCKCYAITSICRQSSMNHLHLDALPCVCTHIFMRVFSVVSYKLACRLVRNAVRQTNGDRSILWQTTNGFKYYSDEVLRFCLALAVLEFGGWQTAATPPTTPARKYPSSLC